MIGRLHGKLLEKQPPMLLLEVGGVGYEIEAPMSTFYVLPAVGESLTLHTHLVVREDSHALYGFATAAERALFRHLIRISGVGAKLALTILSGMSPEGFVACVQSQDAAALVRLPGVGKKTAERLIVEMRDRIKAEQAPAELVAADAAQRPGAAVEDAVNALISLGYKPHEASRMVRSVGDTTQMTSEEIIRRSLQDSVRS